MATLAEQFSASLSEAEKKRVKVSMDGQQKQKELSGDWTAREFRVKEFSDADTAKYAEENFRRRLVSPNPNASPDAYEVDPKGKYESQYDRKPYIEKQHKEALAHELSTDPSNITREDLYARGEQQRDVVNEWAKRGASQVPVEGETGPPVPVVHSTNIGELDPHGRQKTDWVNAKGERLSDEIGSAEQNAGYRSKYNPEAQLKDGLSLRSFKEFNRKDRTIPEAVSDFGVTAGATAAKGIVGIPALIFDQQKWVEGIDDWSEKESSSKRKQGRRDYQARANKWEEGRNERMATRKAEGMSDGMAEAAEQFGAFGRTLKDLYENPADAMEIVASATGFIGTLAVGGAVGTGIKTWQAASKFGKGTEAAKNAVAVFQKRFGITAPSVMEGAVAANDAEVAISQMSQKDLLANDKIKEYMAGGDSFDEAKEKLKDRVGGMTFGLVSVGVGAVTAGLNKLGLSGDVAVAQLIGKGTQVPRSATRNIAAETGKGFGKQTLEEMPQEEVGRLAGAVTEKTFLDPDLNLAEGIGATAAAAGIGAGPIGGVLQGGSQAVREAGRFAGDAPIAEVTERAPGNITWEQEKEAEGTTPEALNALHNLGMDLNINSAHRTAEHNEEVGGAKGSKHLTGNSFDIDLTGMDDKEKRELLVRVKENGDFKYAKIYKTHLHVDTDARGDADFLVQGETPSWSKDISSRVVGTRKSEVGTPAGLIRSESGGDWKAQNDAVGSGGRKGHYGRLQFGHDRLDDAKKALKLEFTTDEFLNSPETQKQVEAWHFSDIKKRINRAGLDQYIGQKINGIPVTMDGMLSAAHLGGFNGLKKYLKSGGKYNPSDGANTLTDYMRKHQGSTAYTGSKTAKTGIGKVVGKIKNKIEERRSAVETDQESEDITGEEIKAAEKKESNTIRTRKDTEDALGIYKKFKDTGNITPDELARYKTAAKTEYERLQTEVIQVLKSGGSAAEIDVINQQALKGRNEYKEVAAAVQQNNVESIIRRASPDSANPPTREEIGTITEAVRTGVFSIDDLKSFGLTEVTSKALIKTLEGAQAESDFVAFQAENSRKGTMQQKFGRGVSEKGKGLVEHSKDISEAIEETEADNNSKTRKKTIDNLVGLNRFLKSQTDKQANYEDALESLEANGKLSPEELRDINRSSFARDAEKGEIRNWDNIKLSLKGDLDQIKGESELMQKVLEGHEANVYDLVAEGYGTQEKYSQQNTGWKNGIPTRKQFKEDIADRVGSRERSTKAFTKVLNRINEILDYKIPAKVSEQDSKDITGMIGALDYYLNTGQHKGKGKYFKGFETDLDLKKQVEDKRADLKGALKKYFQNKGKVSQNQEFSEAELDAMREAAAQQEIDMEAAAASAAESSTPVPPKGSKTSIRSMFGSREDAEAALQQELAIEAAAIAEASNNPQSADEGAVRRKPKENIFHGLIQNTTGRNALKAIAKKFGVTVSFLIPTGKRGNGESVELLGLQPNNQPKVVQLNSKPSMWENAWNAKAWTKPALLLDQMHPENKGKADPLPENIFKNEEQFVQFLLYHEIAHIEHPRKEFKTEAESENFANNWALKQLDLVPTTSTKSTVSAELRKELEKAIKEDPVEGGINIAPNNYKALAVKTIATYKNENVRSVFKDLYKQIKIRIVNNAASLARTNSTELVKRTAKKQVPILEKRKRAILAQRILSGYVHPNAWNTELDLVPKHMENPYTDHQGFIDWLASKDAIALWTLSNNAEPKSSEYWENLYNAWKEESGRNGTKPVTKTINIYSTDKNGYEVLSNFAPRPFYDKHNAINVTDEREWLGYPTVEHAFQGTKLQYSSNISPEANQKFLDQFTSNKISAKDAKSLGARIPLTKENITKWNKDRYSVMEDLVKQSFEQNPKALEILLSTGNAVLTHNGGRKDYWTKNFPKILMEVRKELKKEIKIESGSGKPTKETKPVKPVIKSNRKSAQELYQETKDKGEFEEKFFNYLELDPKLKKDIRAKLDEAIGWTAGGGSHLEHWTILAGVVHDVPELTGVAQELIDNIKTTDAYLDTRYIKGDWGTEGLDSPNNWEEIVEKATGVYPLDIEEVFKKILEIRDKRIELKKGPTKETKPVPVTAEAVAQSREIIEESEAIARALQEALDVGKDC